MTVVYDVRHDILSNTGDRGISAFRAIEALTWHLNGELLVLALLGIVSLSLESFSIVQPSALSES